MNTNSQRIDEYVAANREGLRRDWIELTRRLVGEPTVNVVESKLAAHPHLSVRGEESRAARHVKAWAEGLGVGFETRARHPLRENVILHYGKGRGRSLFVPGHMDVVPAGEGWDADPFVLRVDGDRAIGRGAADNKGPLASILLALRILKGAGLEPEGDFQAAALADEETKGEDGKDYGLEWLLEDGLVKADLAIVPDIGGSMRKIDIAEKGRVAFEVKAFGRQAHGSTPEKGINAINAMAEFLVRLKNHAFPHERHPYLGHCTVNVGEINGGAAPNIVPASCTAVIDMRLVPGQAPEAVRRELDGLAAGLDAAFGVAIRSATEPHELPPDSDLVRAIQDETETVRGERPEVMGLGGGTYAKYLNRHGIEAVGFGPGDEDAMHVANEYASIGEHVAFAHVLARLVMKLV